MQEQELAEATVWSRKPRGLPEVRRIAEQIVASRPWIQAAILFGSRARGTAHRHSDWDVALLAPERYKGEMLRAAPRVPTVSYVPISPRRLRERYNRIGSLERSVAREGILLAGEWALPKTKKRQTVSYSNLGNDLMTSADQVNSAISHIQIIVEWLTASERTEPGYGSNYLCATTQDAGELLSKAALLHLGIHPPKTHDALGLANVLRKKHPKHAWVDVIESLNGRSATRHVAIYNAEIEESITASMERLYKVMRFFAEVFATISTSRLGFAGYLLKISARTIDIVTFHQETRNWERFPEELKQGMMQWKKMAEDFQATKAVTGKGNAE